MGCGVVEAGVEMGGAELQKGTILEGYKAQSGTLSSELAGSIREEALRLKVAQY